MRNPERMPQVFRHPNRNEAIAAAKNDLVAAIARSGAPRLVLLSGGSCLELLESPDALMGLGAGDAIAVVDERLEPGAGNFDRIMRTPAFTRAASGGCVSFDSRFAPDATPEEAAAALEGFVRGYTKRGASVIALLGIGKDGHTAGILPLPEDPEGFRRRFVETGRLYAGYDAGAGYAPRRRVTATSELLLRADAAVVFAVGGKPVDAALEEAMTPEKMPARLLLDLENVRIHTDAPSH